MRTITLLLCVALTATFAHAAPPNIILINADDLGYADLGCYGSTLHRTPRLDQLAKEGVRFTNFYDAANVCSPSRTALMTGCYPKRLGMEQGYPHGIVLFPGDHRGLNPKEVTIARVLRSAGYSTECIGKWHLGDQPIFLPTRHGFDEYFGIPFSNDMGQTERPKNAKPYPPLPFLKYEVVVEQEPDQRYLTTHYTSEAIRFISVNKDKPFFIYLAHSMPHFPQFSSENFAGKSKNGRWGDAVEEIDFETGRLLDYLKQQKLDANTIVLFTSDNGGPTQQGAHNEPLRMGKGSTWEGGHRVPLIVRWPGHVPPGSVCHELAVNFDIPVTLAKIAGSTMPTDRILDGRDITDLLTHPDTAKTKHEAFFYYWMDQLEAVRSGEWKLFVSRHTNKPNEPVAAKKIAELYNLREDVGETKNLAADHPDVVQRLTALIEAARTDLGDSATNTRGQNTREPGFVEHPDTLTH